MKKAKIFLFSGTGNTQKVAKAFQRFFEENDVSCTVEGVTTVDATAVDLSELDFVGFAYPIYGFNPPYAILDFVKKLPKVEGKRYFILKTSGEPLKLNNASSLKMASILKKKGFVLTNEYHYIMPYNIMFRHTEKMAYKMWSTAERLVPIDAKQILDGEHSFLKAPFLSRFISLVLRIEHPALRSHGRLFSVNKKKCTKCGLCIKGCPHQNIKVNSKNQFPKFGGKCALCTACAFFCPKNAVKMGVLNAWKVNGKYKFAEPSEVEVDKHKNYCRKAYERYFKEAEERISANLN